VTIREDIIPPPSHPFVSLGLFNNLKLNQKYVVFLYDSLYQDGLSTLTSFVETWERLVVTIIIIILEIVISVGGLVSVVNLWRIEGKISNRLIIYTHKSS